MVIHQFSLNSRAFQLKIKILDLNSRKLLADQHDGGKKIVVYVQKMLSKKTHFLKKVMTSLHSDWKISWVTKDTYKKNPFVMTIPFSLTSSVFPEVQLVTFLVSASPAKAPSPHCFSLLVPVVFCTSSGWVTFYSILQTFSQRTVYFNSGFSFGRWFRTRSGH